MNARGYFLNPKMGSDLLLAAAGEKVLTSQIFATDAVHTIVILTIYLGKILFVSIEQT